MLNNHYFLHDFKVQTYFLDKYLVKTQPPFKFTLRYIIIIIEEFLILLYDLEVQTDFPDQRLIITRSKFKFILSYIIIIIVEFLI